MTVPPESQKPLGRPPERVIVEVRFKLALGTAPTITTATWPKNWPFPQQGDQIVIGDNTGFVNNLLFDPINGRLVINCR
jgi:hypothetical protein